MISVGGGVIVLVAAAAGYAGLIPRARAGRRALLKRGLCPVCLKPLDNHSARGETITCDCGATWERRFM
jgi:hypothetical protein